jgi:AraC family transcriptional regulator
MIVLHEMSNSPLAFSDPGRFELYFHRSGAAVFAEEVPDKIQICVPLEHAQYSVSQQSKTGRTLVHHMGSRDILAIPMGQPHSVAWRREAAIVSLQLHENFVSEALGGAKLRLPDTCTVRDALVSAAAIALRNEMRAGPSLSPVFAETIATLIAYRVGTAAARSKKVGNRAGEPAFTRAQMIRIERFIDEHLGQSISLPMLAEQFRLTLWHFLRRFQATWGISPHAFITQRRLLRAQSLLMTSEFSVSRIAMEVEMSHSHFSRCFLNHFGQSPREYRRRQLP